MTVRLSHFRCLINSKVPNYISPASVKVINYRITVHWYYRRCRIRENDSVLPKLIMQDAANMK